MARTKTKKVVATLVTPISERRPVPPSPAKIAKIAKVVNSDPVWRKA